ncbi:UDP-Glycosyltransferase/glycogen phosphorylase [Dacryopinax primogenitus]|uniref:UDP-Glycosyltransferase/glycogen phosphorylase n=1 Tax=Dacryopinax primogenitus (strain DJM 731) TaxID=1858805 RepID=M5G3Q8_DACPD|nr:UDP-Glycosyltransferase/glycogen phosphorylase [Dacryopinax primogenitus]EJU04876.1 UDP-Glycosyltransferase/glycogen phosphorylase [Dacryopinax primogenitus]
MPSSPTVFDPEHFDNAEREVRRQRQLAYEQAEADRLANGKLRIAIVTENLMPKVDGVTRTLARLLAHLKEQGHEAVVLGPKSGMSHYETHPLIGTAGIPLVVYPGLKLNFLRPFFLSTISKINPDVVHFVDPIWLGAQVLMAMEVGWCGSDWSGEDAGLASLGTGLGGAPVVASYHTNLPTYATLFGIAWLEPIMWKFTRWLHAKTLLTACPSPSTATMLEGQGFKNVRLWQRGVDQQLFNPYRRSEKLRERWGVQPSPKKTQSASPLAHLDPAAAMLTPPPSPDLLPVGSLPPKRTDTPVVLYVGRVSWEKNLLLLVRSFGLMLESLSAQDAKPILILVGDGPARQPLEEECKRLGIDAVFMGHITGVRLAECYASADIFAFPSFTETFGQVVLEALASGLPVVGLDAEGTRDLVVHERTGLLLPMPTQSPSLVSGEPQPAPEWRTLLTPPTSVAFTQSVTTYASLLKQLVTSPRKREEMARRASTEGVRGRTWPDAMEAMVQCYREAIRVSRAQRPPKQRNPVPLPDVHESLRKRNPRSRELGVLLLICFISSVIGVWVSSGPMRR